MESFINWLSSNYTVLDTILFTIGLVFLFKKYRISPVWAFVPIARNYKLSQCADREEDGITWCIFKFLAAIWVVVLPAVDELFVNYPQVVKCNQIFYYGLLFFELVYNIKVYLGLCEEFGRSKKHILYWFFFEGITMLVWGLNKKFVPKIMHEQEDVNLIEESGAMAKQLDEGLSIDIKARKAKNGIKTKVLLKDIHLSIKPGNMVLLLGGSGAGKTTFLNAVNGYEPADAKIILNGDNVYKSFDKMKYEIGFVPQQDLIRYQDSVYKTLEDAARLRLPSKVHKKEMNERIDEVLNIFGLASVKNNLVGKQSGGQKKRISIATEFISDPSLFILDEPDSGLDGIMARDLMKRLHDISRQGKIVIVITHTPDRVIDLFDEVIVLGKDANRTGRLVFYGSIDDAKKFFEKDTMEDIVRCINREDEGGEGRSDEFIQKYAEVLNGR